MLCEVARQRALAEARGACDLFCGSRSAHALYAKALAFCVAGYALSPIDLSPDFVPVMEYLDDLVIVPLGILAVLRLIPPEIMAGHRAAAALCAERPVSRTAGAAIALVWAASIALVGWVACECYEGWKRIE